MFNYKKIVSMKGLVKFFSQISSLKLFKMCVPVYKINKNKVIPNQDYYSTMNSVFVKNQGL